MLELALNPLAVIVVVIIKLVIVFVPSGAISRLSLGMAAIH